MKKVRFDMYEHDNGIVLVGNPLGIRLGDTHDMSKVVLDAFFHVVRMV